MQESETAITVLPSSTELFYFYGQTLDQCSRYTTGKGMADLATVFKKWLRVYSGMWIRWSDGPPATNVIASR